MPTATTAEIAALKASWSNDPCWDIEKTEGFEAHREELAAYRQDQETQWDDLLAAKVMKRRAGQRMLWGADLPDGACDYLHALEQRLNVVENKASMIKPEALYKE